MEIRTVVDSHSEFARKPLEIIPNDDSTDILVDDPVEINFTPKTPKRVRWSNKLEESKTLIEELPDYDQSLERNQSFASNLAETDAKSNIAPSPYGTSQYLHSSHHKVELSLPFQSVSIEVTCSEGDMSFGYQELDEQVIVDWMAAMMHIAKMQGWQT